MKERYCRRNSLRYPGYDYSQPGACFVTICTHDNQRLFGSVVDGTMSQSAAGAFVGEAWSRLPERFPGIALDAFIVMPDHLHAIIFTGTDPARDREVNTVGFIINSFKNVVTSAWREGASQHGWPRCQQRLWHRDDYDRIVRNERELDARRDYIMTNPARWEAQREQRRG